MGTRGMLRKTGRFAIIGQVLLREIDQGPDDGHSAVKELDTRNHRLQSSVADQVHERRDSRVVGVMAESKFIAARGDGGGEERLAPVPGTTEAIERQRFLRRQFQWDKVIRNAKLPKPRLQFWPPVRETGRDANDVKGQQIILVRNLALIAEQQFEQGPAVFPARDRHRYSVFGGQQIKLLTGPGNRFQQERGNTVFYDSSNPFSKPRPSSICLVTNPATTPPPGISYSIFALMMV